MPIYFKGGISRICSEEYYQRELKPLGYVFFEQKPTKPKEVKELPFVPEDYTSETIEQSDVKKPQVRKGRPKK